MINYNPKNWFTLVFQVHRSESMRYLLPNLLLLGGYTAGFCYIFLEVFHLHFLMKMGLHSLVGIVLGLVLVFRTNTAYDRWWEGRKVWGALVNHSRSMAIKLHNILSPEDGERRKYFASEIANFSFALKDHLRSSLDVEDLDLTAYPNEKFLGDAEHVPNKIANNLQGAFQGMLRKKEISGEEFLSLNRDHDGFIDALGKCERILKTPIPYSYSMYIKKFIFLYLVTLPFGLVEELEYWTIPAVAFIAYVLLGIELLAEEIEDPFGTDANDLDTDGIAKTIRRNVREIFGLTH
ncbi:MAG: hypothetical protein H6581_30915 [Bacteroidia bacterium]|nr:hypothetical protein [Bacteroidia bacterium]